MIDKIGGMESSPIPRQPARRFTELVVWQKAHAFVLLIYKITEQFPKHELFGLTSQLRRAAVSVPANIAEGFKKQSLADKSRILNISQGSLEEARYFLLLAADLQYANTDELQRQADEVSRLLDGYRAGIDRHREV
jgi:four helix bundle protein